MAYIRVDIRELEGLAKTLDGIATGQTLDQAAVTAINSVLDRAEPKLRESIVRTINLSDQYVRDRTVVTKAELGHGAPSGKIAAPARNVPLTRFAIWPLTTRAKSPLRKLKGDPARGIPRGMKAAGIMVEVTRGQPKLFAHGFFSPQQRDSDGNMLIFTRKTKDRYPLQHRFGPAVYQLFRVARDTYLDEITSDLELSLLAEAEAALDEQFLQ